MFSLIITIISIALVAALALATLYFGGDAFNQGSAKAAASTVVNQASQISGANTLYYLDNQAYAADVGTLTPTYLASTPNPGNISDSDYAVGGANDATITLDGLTLAVCEAVNAQAGATDDIDLSTGDTTADGDTDGLPDALDNFQFGCVTADQASYTFYFK